MTGEPWELSSSCRARGWSALVWAVAERGRAELSTSVGVRKRMPIAKTTTAPINANQVKEILIGAGCADRERPEQVQQIDVQAAEEDRRDQADRDGEHVAAVGAAGAREHADQEDAEHRAEDEAGDAEHDRDDAHVGVGHLGVGEHAGDSDHQDREDAR